MKQSLMHTMRGYLEIQMTGYTPERFLNLCRNHRIGIWQVRFIREDQSYLFFVPLRDYQRIRPIVRKCGVHLNIKRKLGLPFFLYRNRKRKLYAAGMLAFWFVMLFMTQFVWNISLEGNCRFSDDTLLSYLAKQDIHYGMLKRKVDCAGLEEELRSHFPEILWVSARISGTRLLIHVKENSVIREIPKEENDPCDLVSSADGVIIRMIVRSGKAAVAEGDEIRRGQLLVSGILPITDDSDTVIAEKQVHADADIYARTERTIRRKLTWMQIQRQKTGRKNMGFFVEIGQKGLRLMLPLRTEDFWRTVSERRQVTLFGDFYLPLWITRVYAEEYQLSERPALKEELEAEKDKLLAELAEKFRQKGVVIIENNVKIQGRTAELSFVLEEPVAVEKKLTELKEKKQPDEYNRDNH